MQRSSEAHDKLVSIVFHLSYSSPTVVEEILKALEIFSVDAFVRNCSVPV